MKEIEIKEKNPCSSTYIGITASIEPLAGCSASVVVFFFLEPFAGCSDAACFLLFDMLCVIVPCDTAVDALTAILVLERSAGWGQPLNHSILLPSNLCLVTLVQRR